MTSSPTHAADQCGTLVRAGSVMARYVSQGTMPAPLSRTPGLAGAGATAARETRQPLLDDAAPGAC